MVLPYMGAMSALLHAPPLWSGRPEWEWMHQSDHGLFSHFPFVLGLLSATDPARLIPLSSPGGISPTNDPV